MAQVNLPDKNFLMGDVCYEEVCHKENLNFEE